MTAPARHGPRLSFAHPEGVLGRFAARLMAVAGRRRSQEVLLRLDLRPSDRVLEIGFGAGDDLARASARVGPTGSVSGIDSSKTLVGQARRRFRAVIAQGRMVVTLASADDPFPFPDGAFTKAFSINSFQFWADPVASLQELHRVLVPGAKVILAVQPKGELATTTTPAAMLEILTQALQRAGFDHTQGSLCPMRPRAVAIVQALRPEGRA